MNMCAAPTRSQKDCMKFLPVSEIDLNKTLEEDLDQTLNLDESYEEFLDEQEKFCPPIDENLSEKDDQDPGPQEAENFINLFNYEN